jgi:hypothetical protein
MSVELAPGQVTLTPFDRRTVPGEGEACILELRRLLHEAELTLLEAGTTTLIVRGRRVTREEDEVIEMRHPILAE